VRQAGSWRLSAFNQDRWNQTSATNGIGGELNGRLYKRLLRECCWAGYNSLMI
jgi:hypothetical protein